jgi:hypothetical protein
MKRTQTLLAALLLGLTLILAGCGSGGGSDDDGVASATGKDSKKDSDDDGTSEEDRQAAGLKFAKCMREHGVEMEDPKGGRITVKSGPGDQANMEKAQEACQKYLPKISEADRKKGADQALKFAKCMRKNGVEDFPDPDGMGIRIDGGIGDDPDFKKAQEACQDIMGGPGLRSGKGA